MIRALFVAAALLATPAAAVDIQTVTSPGGINAWLVEDHELPFTALEIWFQGGSSLDQPGKRGAVSLMTSLLEEGAGDRNAVAFSEARESLAASYGFEASNDVLTVSAQFLTENRDASVALLKDALTHPRFDPDAVERVRGQLLSVIESEARDPSSIASEQLSALAYGADPYGSSPNGTRDSVAALTRDDLVAAHAATVARDRVIVSAVGDISAQELGALIDTLLGDLPETGAPLPGRPDLGLSGGVTVIDYASPQSQVVFGQQGLPIGDPDYFAAMVMNHILGGGGFSSRLMDEVREKRGLTYGIGTSLVNRQRGDLLLGSVASANEKVAEAMGVIRDEWARMRDGGVTEAELKDAKTYLTGAYPLRFDGNAQIAGILAGMQFNGMPPDYVNTRNAQVEKVTASDVARVAKRLLDPDALRFVVVGQPQGVTATP